MNEIKVNDTVEWSSQSQGSSKTKRGKVLEVVKPGEHLDSWFRRTKKSHIKFDPGVRTFERLLVEVPRGGKSKLSDLYCPRLSSVKKVDESEG